MSQLPQIDCLEQRQLFAALVPELAWGNDGAVPGLYDSTELVGVTGGRIVSALSFYNESGGNSITFTRTLPTGTPDPRFRPIEFRGFFVAADLDEQARLVTGASGNGDLYSVQIGRFSASGNRDRTFGTNGTTVFTFRTGYKPLNAYTVIRDVEVGHDGSVLALIEGGKRVYNGIPGERRLLVARFTAAGQLDIRYGQGGLIDLGGSSFTNLDGIAPKLELHVDAKGRLYLEGEDSMSRFRANGTRDRAFAVGGRLGLGGADFVLDAKGRPLLADGVAGEARIRRLDTFGQADPTFYDQGQIRLDGGDSTDIRLIAMPEGDLLLQFGTRVIQLLPETQGFGVEGNTEDQIAGNLPDGSVLAIGNNESGRGLFRLTNAPQAQLGRLSGKLYVWGENGVNDSAYVRLEGGRLRVGVNGKARYFDASAVREIDVRLGNGNNTFTSSADVRTVVTSGDGDDTVVTGNASDFIHVNGGNDRVNAGAGQDYVYGGAGKDTLYGDAGNDEIVGEDGNDYLVGGIGSDRIHGNEGNDQLFAGTPGRARITGITNYLFGDEGNDIAFLESDTDTTGDIEAIT